MGALHVVTGADHISAVASLACGNSRWRAFWLGVRWGAGHSVGLVIVFVAVLALEKETDAGFMRGMNRWMGAVVGLLMIALGLYGARRARNKSDDGGDDDDARDAAPDDEEEETTAPLVGARPRGPPPPDAWRRTASRTRRSAGRRTRTRARSDPAPPRPTRASSVSDPDPRPRVRDAGAAARNAPVAVGGGRRARRRAGAVSASSPRSRGAPRLSWGTSRGSPPRSSPWGVRDALGGGGVAGGGGEEGAGDGENLGVRQLGGVRDRRRRVRRAHPAGFEPD